MSTKVNFLNSNTLENKIVCSSKNIPLAQPQKQSKSNYSLVQFNIDMPYILKLVRNKQNDYLIDSSSLNSKQISIDEQVCNFVTNHKKTEKIRLIEKSTGIKRFEGIVFVSKKQGCCLTYAENGSLTKRENFINDSKTSFGYHLHENGKHKIRSDYSKTMQEENGFCITYHPNGSIKKIGKKVLGNFTDMFAEFYYNGTMEFVREKSVRSFSEMFDLLDDDCRFSESGMLFYEDGSRKFYGRKETWYYDSDYEV